jgi:hypothetical protein
MGERMKRYTFKCYCMGCSKYRGTMESCLPIEWKSCNFLCFECFVALDKYYRRIEQKNKKVKK